jgi:hypothetical protein
VQHIEAGSIRDYQLRELLLAITVPADDQTIDDELIAAVQSEGARGCDHLTWRAGFSPPWPGWLP